MRGDVNLDALSDGGAFLPRILCAQCDVAIFGFDGIASAILWIMGDNLAFNRCSCGGLAFALCALSFFNARLQAFLRFFGQDVDCGLLRGFIRGCCALLICDEDALGVVIAARDIAHNGGLLSGHCLLCFVKIALDEACHFADVFGGLRVWRADQKRRLMANAFFDFGVNADHASKWGR